jgi:hypothetical protein
MLFLSVVYKITMFSWFPKKHQSRKRVKYAFLRVFIIISVFKMVSSCLVLLISAGGGPAVSSFETTCHLSPP